MSILRTGSRVSCRAPLSGLTRNDPFVDLALFAGLLFRRFHGDLTYFLQYIVHQLYAGQTTEITVLKELIWHMAGIEPLPNMSDSQVIAMAGGPFLQIEAIASATRGARLDNEQVRYRGSNRLGDALCNTGLALPLLIQIAQQRESCVFKAPDTHLKSLASLYDTVSDQLFPEYHIH